MSMRNIIKKRFYCLLTGVFLMLIGLVAPVNSAFAEPNESLPRIANEIQADDAEILETSEEETLEEPETPEEPAPEEPETPEEPAPEPIDISPIDGENCSSQLSPVGWLVCPVMEVISKAVDSLYDVIEDLLVITPLSNEVGSPIFTVWQYCLNLTNIIFIIFFLVVIYSQVTGVGISNYGIKKVLPKLIVAAVLVNLSFHICALVVDVSNIIGSSLRGFFENIPIQVGEVAVGGEMSFTEVAGAVLGGAGIGGALGAVAFQAGALWMLIPTILGGLVAIVSGLITIAIRQAVVILLVMISPLALVCYMLPNTESLYRKWKDLFKKMLVFYPMFSLLFGAASLAGWAIIANAVRNNSMFMVILGLAVQVFPLFGSWSLMKMSGTFLNSVNQKMHGLAAKPLAANRKWAESRRDYTKSRSIAELNNPYARLQQYMLNRKTVRDFDTENAQNISKRRASIYAQSKIANYKDITEGKLVANKMTRRLKLAKNLDLKDKTTTAHVEHLMSKYDDIYIKGDATLTEVKNIESKIDKAGSKDAAKLTAGEKITLQKFSQDARYADHKLARQSANNFLSFMGTVVTKELDDEDDIGFFVDQYLSANDEDSNGFKAPALYDRYYRAVGGDLNRHRVLAKVITQAAKVESKQRSEYNTLLAKYGHNGFSKREFRDWLAGYHNNDDGFAVDKNGKKLLWTKEDAEAGLIPLPANKTHWTKLDYEMGKISEDRIDTKIIQEDFIGKEIEIAPGDIFTKAPHRIPLYEKQDEKGLYFDFKDQNGKRLARIYRDGTSKGDDGAFIKEVLSNYDIPIGDPINDVYGILSGIKAGDIKITKDGKPVKNYIGLERYSTTIGRALMSSGYKSNAPWAGSMFASMVGNRQIHNSAQQAIAVLDSIVKTMKPGTFNTQNPASASYIKNMLFDVDNWDKIFDEKSLRGVVNINNEPLVGEIWEIEKDENGEEIYVDDGRGNLIPKYVFDKNGKVVPKYSVKKLNKLAKQIAETTDDEEYKKLQKDYAEAAAELKRLAENPTYEELMNKVKSKYIFPAIQKILPAFDRMRTSGTADNQKPGTADEFINIINLINNDSMWGEKRDKAKIPFEPLLVNQDLSNETRALREKKHDKDNNYIYKLDNGKKSNGFRWIDIEDRINEANGDVEHLINRLIEYFQEHNRPEVVEALKQHAMDEPTENFQNLVKFIEEDLSKKIYN